MATFEDKLKILIEFGYKDVALKQFEQRMKDVQQQIKHTQRRLLLGGLGFLFFGMTLQRLFQGLIKSGTHAFRDITEATYGTQTAMTGLAAAGNFLMFTLGDALNTVLEPLMPVILGIVDAIANFIQEHPEVALGLVAGAFIAMTLITIGQLMTLMSSMMALFGGSAGSVLAANALSVEDAFFETSKLSFSGLITELGVLAIAIGTVYVAAKTLDNIMTKITGYTPSVKAEAKQLNDEMIAKGFDVIPVPEYPEYAKSISGGYSTGAFQFNQTRAAQQDYSDLLPKTIGGFKPLNEVMGSSPTVTVNIKGFTLLDQSNIRSFSDLIADAISRNLPNQTISSRG